MRSLIFLSLICILLQACGHNPLDRKLDQPQFYADNALSLNPKRLWRLKLSWEPYLLDESKAIVLKEFQLEVRDADARAWLENEIESRGGDVRFLRWFESEVFPIGSWEKVERAKVARYKDRITAVIATRAVKEVSRSQWLATSPIDFPDPLLGKFRDGCHGLNWEVIPGGDSFGTEVVLESRKQNPSARRWQKLESDDPQIYWRAWSVGQEKQISYRTLFKVKQNISRCPPPPQVAKALERLTNTQAMGVDW